MKASVLVPIRVTRKEFTCYIENLVYCLTAVRKQEFSDFECIVIDYGSVAPVQKKIKKYVKKYKFEYLRGEGTIWSRSRSLNLGIDAAKGDIIMFIDADCVMRTDYIAKNVATVGAGDNIFACNPVYDTNKGVKKSADATSLASFCGQKPRPGGISHIGIRREWLMTHGGFNNAYRGWGGEDNDLWFRLRKSGNKPKYTKTAAYHLWHPTYEELMRSIGAHGLFKRLRAENRKRYAELKAGGKK